MADLPIIFSAPMVRALLEGRKTQTRRVLKVDWNNGANPAFTGWHSGRIGPRQWQLVGGMGVGATVKTAYAPGDRLYVREAIDKVSEPGAVFYRADYEAGGNDGTGLGWRPSIHMPRWASRLTLTVTDVRVQRLQDISEADAVAEGIERLKSGRGFYDPTMSHGAVHAGHYFSSARETFQTLWNSLHGPEAWGANPWVAAYSFTVQRGNIDQIGGAE